MFKSVSMSLNLPVLVCHIRYENQYTVSILVFSLCSFHCRSKGQHKPQIKRETFYQN